MKTYKNNRLASVIESSAQRGWNKAPSYTCPELGETCLRKGAYDAFKLPSIVNDRRVFRNQRTS